MKEASHLVVRIMNRTRKRELASRASVADTFVSRLVGLLGRRELAAGEGLVITRTNSVHSLGMRFAIDVVHLDRHGRVCRLVAPLLPWRVGPVVRGGDCVIELPAGVVAATGIAVGDEIEIIPLVGTHI